MLACCAPSFVAFAPHAVKSLPGLSDELPSSMYAGHLDASPSRHLFYTLVESQRSPQSDPLSAYVRLKPAAAAMPVLNASAERCC